MQTHLNFTVPPLLREAFAAAAQDHLTGKPFRVLTVSNTRETLFFDLRRDFPMLNMNMTCAINDPGHAGNNNYLLMRDAKEISGDLSYSTGWQPQAYDLVHVNAAIFYEDENGVKTLVHDIAATGPERVVFTNLINSSGDKPEWFAQRSRGGVVPMRALPPQEIVTLMQTAGYKLVDRQTAPATYNVQIGVDVSQLLQNDNLSFVKDHAPA